MRNGNGHGELRYSDEDLKHFKALIELKLAVEQAVLKEKEERLIEINQELQHPMRGGDLKDLRVEREEKIIPFVKHLRETVRKLEFALFRIENKTYGVCYQTNSLISKDRLEANLVTTKSARAKARNGSQFVNVAV